LAAEWRSGNWLGGCSDKEAKIETVTGEEEANADELGLARGRL
jgi:hypothetical protein